MGLGLQHIQMVGGVIQFHQYGPRSFLMAAVGGVVISSAEMESGSGMGQLTSPALNSLTLMSQRHWHENIRGTLGYVGLVFRTMRLGITGSSRGVLGKIQTATRTLSD